MWNFKTDHFFYSLLCRQLIEGTEVLKELELVPTENERPMLLCSIADSGILYTWFSHQSDLSVMVYYCAFDQLFLYLIKWCLITLDSKAVADTIVGSYTSHCLSSPAPTTETLSTKYSVSQAPLQPERPFESTVASGSREDQWSCSRSSILSWVQIGWEPRELLSLTSPPPLSGIFTT